MLEKYSTGKIIQGDIEIIPLTPEERQKVEQVILSSEFIKDVPAKNPIVLRFFDFENGQRIWQDGFLIGKDGIIIEGDPTIFLSLHTKYIAEFNGNNLCEIIQRAKSNNDLGFHSESNKASLFLKYSSMLKHRKCFGF